MTAGSKIHNFERTDGLRGDSHLLVKRDQRARPCSERGREMQRIGGSKGLMRPERQQQLLGLAMEIAVELKQLELSLCDVAQELLVDSTRNSAIELTFPHLANQGRSQLSDGEVGYQQIRAIDEQRLQCVAVDLAHVELSEGTRVHVDRARCDRHGHHSE